MNKEDQINYLADRGFVVIPLNGKRPIIKGWQTLDIESGRSKTTRFFNSNSDINLGILTGIPSSIVVIDIDLRENGISNWLDIVSDRDMEDTFVVKTGSGGYHIYYQYDHRLSMCRKITGVGIDFKSNGGQVVAPGSIHPDTGNVYTICYGFHGGEMVIAKFPEFLIEMFSK